jgi:signal transduction histidine kinase
LAHDGAITYASAPGQGTTFHLTIGVNTSPVSLMDNSIDSI